MEAGLEVGPELALKIWRLCHRYDPCEVSCTFCRFELSLWYSFVAILET